MCSGSCTTNIPLTWSYSCSKQHRQTQSPQVTASFILILNREKSNEDAHWLVTSSYRYTSTNNTTGSCKSTPDNRSNIIENREEGWRNAAAEPKLTYEQNTAEYKDFGKRHLYAFLQQGYKTGGWSNWHPVKKRKEEITAIIATTLHTHRKLAWIIMYSLGRYRSLIIYSTAHWNVSHQTVMMGKIQLRWCWGCWLRSPDNKICVWNSNLLLYWQVFFDDVKVYSYLCEFTWPKTPPERPEKPKKIPDRKKRSRQF